MRFWLVMFGGLVLWTVHFFALYALASVFGSGPAGRLGSGLVTIACLIAAVGLTAFCAALLRDAPSGGFGRWTAGTGLAAAALSVVAVLWQGLPALIG